MTTWEERNYWGHWEDGAVEVFIPGHLDTGLAPYPFNIQRPLRVIFGTIQSPRHV